jgi:hypothetical protein
MSGLAALQPAARPVRRPPSTALPRLGRVLAALPCGCRCGRRHLLGASSAAALSPLVAPPSRAAPPIDPDVSSFTIHRTNSSLCDVDWIASPALLVYMVGQVMLEQVHPSRPDWYEKFYAMAMDKGMKSYDSEVCCFISGFN